VLLATAFMVVCAAGSIAFVAANGGLQAPRFVAAASTGPSQAQPSPEPTPAGPTPGSEPSPAATTAAPTVTPPSPSVAPTPISSVDPLSALPACPGHPGCYLYTIRRGDTLSTIGDHWLISVAILEVLNPQVTDPSTIVVGQILYLGRTPYVRLDLCPGHDQGCYLYVVRPGDRLSTIAGRFGTTTSRILALNPQITDPNAIYTGQTIMLPGP
jgi:LysM repeat protein